MRPPRSASILLLCSLLLAACDSPAENAAERAIERETGGEADVDLGDGTMHVETDEGTLDVGGGEVPADWPEDVAVYPDATVVSTASVNPATGKAGRMLMLTTEDARADVRAHYETALVEDGWTIEAAADIGGAVILGATKADRTLSLQIVDQDGKTGIIIGLSAKE